MAQAAADATLAPSERTGMWVYLATDVMSFAALLFADAALRLRSPDWPSPRAHLGLGLTSALTLALVASSATMLRAMALARAGRRASRWLAATAALGALFLVGQAYEWHHLAATQHMTLTGEGFVGGDPRFASTFFVLTGFHGLHVAVGAALLAALAVARPRASTVENAGLFWHFVDGIWLVVFAAVYVL